MDGVTRGPALASDERQLRIDLAAAFRLAARFDWHEAVANHFSAATSTDGRHFLMNPLWRHFAGIRASDLLLLDSHASDLKGLPPVDATAWAIHGTMHATLPRARCVLHVHPPYATALACLADPRILPIEQTSARFFNRIAIDRQYTGLADTPAEGARLAQALGDKQILMMGNHGVLVVGDTVAETFDALYHVERASRTLMLAYASGQPLSVLSDAVAEKTARAWEDGGAFARAHFSELKRMLDADEPSYLE